MALQGEKKEKISVEADEKVEESSKVPDVASSSSQPTSRRQGTNTMGFRIDFAMEAADKCLQDEGINTDAYIDLFTEFMSVLEAIGPLFSFVKLDVHDKVEILLNFRIGEGKERYRTVEGMLQDILDAPETRQQENAGRTLLMLHRSLPLVSKAFRVICKAERDDKLGENFREVYKATMAKHHPKQVQQIVNAVLAVAPTFNFVWNRMVGTDSASKNHIRATAPALCDRLDQLFQTTQDLYDKYDMLDLP